MKKKAANPHIVLSETREYLAFLVKNYWNDWSTVKVVVDYWLTNHCSSTLNPSLPCWLPWRWNLGQQARWSPAQTGSGCRSEATPPPPCRSEIRLGKSVDGGLRIIHSGRISSAERPSPKRGPDSRSRTALTRPGEMCWGPWRRRWARRWSSYAERITP